MKNGGKNKSVAFIIFFWYWLQQLKYLKSIKEQSNKVWESLLSTIWRKDSFFWHMGTGAYGVY